MGDGCLSKEHFDELSGILKGKLEEHFKNQRLRQGEEKKLNISLKKCSDISLHFWSLTTGNLAVIYCYTIYI